MDSIGVSWPLTLEFVVLVRRCRVDDSDVCMDLPGAFSKKSDGREQRGGMGNMLVVNLVVFTLVCAAPVWVGYKLDTDWGQKIWNRIYKYGVKCGGQLRLHDYF